MLLQPNAILLLDSKQNTLCLSQSEIISFIKTEKLLKRSVNFSIFIKNITPPHIFLIFLKWAYIWGILFSGKLIYGTAFVLVLYFVGLIPTQFWILSFLKFDENSKSRKRMTISKSPFGNFTKVQLQQLFDSAN